MSIQSREDSENDFKQKRGIAMGFGALVYGGVILAATTIFITFILSAFPQNAYFSRTVMTISGLLIGLSMFAFPLALHYWAITKVHRRVTMTLYYVEMILIAINTFVGFVNLLAKYSNYTVPEWSVLYEPFSVASIIYTLAAWGTIFLLDPAGTRRAMARQYEERFEDDVAKRRSEFLDTVEGREAIARAATQDINAHLARNRNEIPSWNTGTSTGQTNTLNADARLIADVIEQITRQNSQPPPQ